MNLHTKILFSLSENSPGTFLKKGLIYISLYSSISSTVTASPYWLIASQYYQWRHQSDLRQYGVNINPFKHRWVDPDEITRFTGRPGRARSKEDIGAVHKGNWDQKLPDQQKSDPLRRREERFEDHLVYRSFESHFEDNVAWQETELVQYVLGEIDRGNRCWGSETHEEVWRRCDRLDTLYEQVSTHGYRTKLELMGIKPSRFQCRLDRSVRRYSDADHITRSGHNPVRGFRSLIANEVMVDIGRDGELLFVDGRHRLSIAKILGLDRIPVVVLVRHKKWVETLSTVVSDNRDINEVSLGIADHPDVQAYHGQST